MLAPAWVKDAIFYQIFPDRFCRSERYHAAGKFVPWDTKPTRENMFGGNLAGIESKLTYIKGLGANAIYLCPIFKSNSNHRYHTVDYFEIDPVLGTLADFDRLVEKAHRLGLRIILDGVFNHCSRGFFQFNSLMELGPDSPYVDWFHVKGWPLNAYSGNGGTTPPSRNSIPTAPKYANTCSGSPNTGQSAESTAGASTCRTKSTMTVSGRNSAGGSSGSTATPISWAKSGTTRNAGYRATNSTA